MTNRDLLRYVDPETGTTIDTLPIYRPKPQTFQGDYVVMFQQPMVHLATNTTLTPQSVRVLLLLLSKLDYDNRVFFKQKSIAEQLNTTAPRISMALKQLREANILRKDDDGCWHLNPTYAWKGNAKQHRAANRAIKKPKAKVYALHAD